MIKIQTCLFCGKVLSKEQIAKKNKTCSRYCAFRLKKYEHQQKEPNFFLMKDINTLFYLIGLLFTDGNLDSCKKRITLSLTEKNVIYMLFPYFSSNDKKIYEYQPKSENANIIYTTINESTEAINILTNKYDFEPCNSVTKKMPNIPDEYFGDFLRGVFDGDGCVYISNKARGKKYLAISITCASQDFIYSLRGKLENLGFHPTIVIDSRRKEQKIKTYYLKRNRQQEIKNFYNLIYKNATIKNQTKYRKFYYEDIV